MTIQIDREVITLNLKQELLRQKECKLIYTIVRQVAEKWDGKKLSKNFAKDVQERLGDRYDVMYWHDKPFWRKINVDKKNMRNFREEIVLHHDSHGEKFSLIRFLDGGNSRVGVHIQAIATIEAALADKALLDNLEGTLQTFEEQFNNFKKRMETFREIKHLLDPRSADFLRSFHV